MANLPDLAYRDAATIVQIFRYTLTLQPTPCAVRRHVELLKTIVRLLMKQCSSTSTLAVSQQRQTHYVVCNTS